MLFACGRTNEMDQKEVKSIIKATLISNPLKTTVRQLQREFFKSEGIEIPYKQFGFANLGEYLYSIPDAVQIIGHGYDAEVRVVLNQKSAHVAQMVSKQRMTVKKPRFSRFNNRPMRVERAQYISEPSGRRPFFQNNTRQTTDTSHERKFYNNFDKNKVRLRSATHDSFNFNNKSDTWDGEDDFEEEVVDEDDEPRLISVINQANNSVNEKIPVHVQRNLDELIKKFPNGLLCSKLLTEYRELYRTNLNYADYGFKSLIQLCCELTAIFKFVRPDNGDYVLFHVDCNKNSRPDFREEQKLAAVQRGGRMIESKPAVPDNLTDVLKTIQITPPHVMSLSDVIPQQKIVSKVGDYIDIQIAEIYDPSKFWFNMDFLVDELDKLMDRMQSFYSENYRSYLISSCDIQENLHCVASYMNEYHRAVIINLMPQSKNTVKVFFFDYGTVSTIPVDALCYLHKSFAQLPAQAKRGRLAQIRPPHRHEMWSTESSSFFLDLIRNKVCVAEIFAIDESLQVYELLVADTNGEVDIFINDSLVNEGHAISEHQEWVEDVCDYGTFAPCVDKIYLYPMFDEIEGALVPSFLEMLEIFKEGTPLDKILPQYFKKKVINRKIEDNLKNVSSIDCQFMTSYLTDTEHTNCQKEVDRECSRYSKFDARISTSYTNNKRDVIMPTNNSNYPTSTNNLDTISSFRSNDTNYQISGDNLQCSNDSNFNYHLTNSNSQYPTWSNCGILDQSSSNEFPNITFNHQNAQPFDHFQNPHPNYDSRFSDPYNIKEFIPRENVDFQHYDYSQELSERSQYYDSSQQLNQQKSQETFAFEEFVPRIFRKDYFNPQISSNNLSGYQNPPVGNFEVYADGESVPNLYPSWSDNVQSNLNVNAPSFLWNGNLVNTKEIEANRIWNAENVDIVSNVESVEIISNRKNVEIISNEENVEMVNNEEYVEIISNEENVEMVKNEEYVEIISNVENVEMVKNEEYVKIISNEENVEMVINEEYVEIISNEENIEIFSNEEKLETISNTQIDDEIISNIKIETISNEKNYEKVSTIIDDETISYVQVASISNRKILNQIISDVINDDEILSNTVDQKKSNINNDDKQNTKQTFILKTEISGLTFHVLLYNKEPHIMINELQKHCTKLSLLLFKRALYLEKAIDIIDIHKSISTDLFNELMKLNLMDEETLIVDVIPLRNLPDVASLLENKIIVPDDLEVVFKKFNVN